MARNSKGEARISGCLPLLHCSDAEEAESKAALFGIQLITDLQPTKLIVELDCQSVVSVLRSNDLNRSKNWATIDEIKKLLSSLQEVSIVQVRRNYNSGRRPS